MTRATTEASAEGRRGRLWFWLVLLSIGLHVAGWLLLEPVGRTEMVFDRDAAEQQVAEVRERENERREREARKRERIPLDKEAALELAEQAERQRREEAFQELRRLEKVKDDIEALRDEAFETIRQREMESIVRADLPELEKAMDDLEYRVDALRERTDYGTEENETMKQRLDAAKRALMALSEDPDRGAEVAADLAEELSELDQQVQEARVNARRRGNEDRASAASRAAEPARESRNLARKLAAKTRDLKAFNSTESAQSLAGSEAAAATEDRPKNLAEAYEQASAAEAQARRAYADLRAAQLARQRNRSFAEAQSQVGSAQTPERPNLSEALARTTPGNVGQLNDYRETVQQARNQMNDMSLRSQALLAQARGDAMSMQGSALGRAMTEGGSEFSTGINTGEGYNEGLDRGADEAVFSAGGSNDNQLPIAEKQIIREALPGRMFTDASDRQGWLYLDTWYVIGPWGNGGEPNFDEPHPPETEIDYDARYTDGKYARRDGHPDQVLKWHFVQSDEVRIQPHRTYSTATYYAYTEVYFDEPRDMVLAFGADAAGRIWVNGELQWEDNLRSLWRLVEGYQTVRFKRGYNRILVRIMNGSGECAFSVLLCPDDLADTN